MFYCKTQIKLKLPKKLVLMGLIDFSQWVESIGPLFVIYNYVF